VAFFKPTEVDRKVLAVYFNPVGSVDKVANYGLKDGQVVNLVSKETPSHASEKNLLQQLFRNLGSKQLYGQ
jgi:outer membrane protein assembly factor BamE (lipoprotein component of BamABCDE complex)